MKDCSDIRINYLIDEGFYCGYIVNFESLLCQAESLEELETNLKKTLKMWINHWDEKLKKPDFTINSVEQSGEEWLKK
jgi:predicted RNase H-like HicB family nuclease